MLAPLQVLDEYVHSRIVHFATIDIEGAEYELIDALRNKQNLDKEGIIFCQVKKH